jgi:hypothetical protein
MEYPRTAFWLYRRLGLKPKMTKYEKRIYAAAFDLCREQEFEKGFEAAKAVGYRGKTPEDLDIFFIKREVEPAV